MNKLSKLQKAILVAAYRHAPERDGKEGKDGAHLLTQEALHEVCGWPYRPDPHLWNSNHFRQADIGVERWRSDRASLSRAFRRLEARGLVEVWRSLFRNMWSGVVLTDAGRAVAAQLAETADKKVSPPSVNPLESALTPECPDAYDDDALDDIMDKCENIVRDSAARLAETVNKVTLSDFVSRLE